jgi:hypothetical protein
MKNVCPDVSEERAASIIKMSDFGLGGNWNKIIFLPQSDDTQFLNHSTYLTILTYLFHGKESFLSQSRNSPHFMEPGSSLPYSQVPATSPYPEPTSSSPHNPLPLPEDPS